VLYEWHTGILNSTEFSANMFIDVYSGHVGMLEHIRENWGSAFHLIMTEIYTLARSIIFLSLYLLY
jgi:hypothetical protein